MPHSSHYITKVTTILVSVTNVIFARFELYVNGIIQYVLFKLTSFVLCF